MAPIGPTTESSASPLKASPRVTTGAAAAPARATALPDRVDRDLRISRPTSEAADGPVDRTAGRGAVGQDVGHRRLLQGVGELE